MKLHEVITKTIELRGNSIVREERMVNILSDLHAFDDFTPGKEIIKKICSCNGLQLYCMFNKEPKLEENIVRLELDKYSYELSKKYGFRRDFVRYCLESIAYSLKLINSITSLLNDSTKQLVSFVGHWDFYYKEKEKMTLTIKHDGTALASSGTGYHWKTISNNEILIFIESMVCYRGSLEDSVISGIAYSDYCSREWPWIAKLRDDGLNKINLISGQWILENDVEGLDYNILEFHLNGIVNSQLYGEGSWTVEDEILIFTTANGFITYTAHFEKGKIIGVARNKACNKWNFKLTKKM